jgi:hypothetical protein
MIMKECTGCEKELLELLRDIRLSGAGRKSIDHRRHRPARREQGDMKAAEPDQNNKKRSD